MARRWQQVRVYVVSGPSPRVKDLRTGIERDDVAAVLAGDLDAFLVASIRQGLGRDHWDDPRAPVPEAEVV